MARGQHNALYHFKDCLDCFTCTHNQNMKSGVLVSVGFHDEICVCLYKVRCISGLLCSSKLEAVPLSRKTRQSQQVIVRIGNFSTEGHHIACHVGQTGHGFYSIPLGCSPFGSKWTVLHAGHVARVTCSGDTSVLYGRMLYHTVVSRFF